MRIGLLGGTFNPIHCGHLHIAKEVFLACGLDEVWFVPTCRPPHKELVDGVPFAHRLAMVTLAVASFPHFKPCDIEGKRGGKSYSVDTLSLLVERYPDHEFYFIMGLDSFQEIGLWKDYQRLFELAHIVVTARPGFGGSVQDFLPVAIADRFCYDADFEKLQCDTGFSLIPVTHTCRDISSTVVRQMLAETQICTRHGSRKCGSVYQGPRIVFSVISPEPPEENFSVSNSELSKFSQGQGSRAVEHGRRCLRCTIQLHRLTQRLRKRAVSGQKPA